MPPLPLVEVRPKRSVALRSMSEMAVSGRRLMPESDEKYYCAYAARKDGHTFAHTREEVMDRYRDDIVLQEEMPPIDWPSMGRYVYMARFTDEGQMDQFFRYVLE